MKREKRRRPRLVLVEWNDAASANPGWMNKEEVLRWAKPDCLIRNAGYVIQRNRNVLVLAARWDMETGAPLFGLLQRIPTGMIRRIYRLKEPKANA